MNSYLGIPIKGETGAVVGHLVQRQRNTTAAEPVVERTQDIKP